MDRKLSQSTEQALLSENSPISILDYFSSKIDFCTIQNAPFITEDLRTYRSRPLLERLWIDIRLFSAVFGSIFVIPALINAGWLFIPTETYWQFTLGRMGVYYLFGTLCAFTSLEHFISGVSKSLFFGVHVALLSIFAIVVVLLEKRNQNFVRTLVWEAIVGVILVLSIFFCLAYTVFQKKSKREGITLGSLLRLFVFHACTYFMWIFVLQFGTWWFEAINDQEKQTSLTGLFFAARILIKFCLKTINKILPYTPETERLAQFTVTFLFAFYYRVLFSVPLSTQTFLLLLLQNAAIDVLNILAGSQRIYLSVLVHVHCAAVRCFSAILGKPVNILNIESSGAPQKELGDDMTPGSAMWDSVVSSSAEMTLSVVHADPATQSLPKDNVKDEGSAVNQGKRQRISTGRVIRAAITKYEEEYLPDHAIDICFKEIIDIFSLALFLFFHMLIRVSHLSNSYPTIETNSNMRIYGIVLLVELVQGVFVDVIFEKFYGVNIWRKGMKVLAKPGTCILFGLLSLHFLQDIFFGLFRP